VKASEAAKVVGVLAAYFPGARLGEETVTLWAREVQAFEFADGVEAAEVLGTFKDRLPSLAEFVASVQDCRNARLAKRPALPEGDPMRWPDRPCSLADFLSTNPEMAERVSKLHWWGDTLKRIEEATPDLRFPEVLA
jgi:hypothetical protein